MKHYNFGGESVVLYKDVLTEHGVEFFEFFKHKMSGRTQPLCLDALGNFRGEAAFFLDYQEILDKFQHFEVKRRRK